MRRQHYRRGQVWRATDQERALFLQWVGIFALGISFGLWFGYWMVVHK